METSAAVSEVLLISNYFVWSVQMRTYLIAQDLWNIVEATKEPCKQENDEAASKAWTKKNAMALHVIQISCDPRQCFMIGWITSAKIAWETLKEICSLRKPKSIYSVFDEQSYVAWSVPMRAYLMEHNLWDVIEAATEPPTPEYDEIACPDWSKKNALALYLIFEWSECKKFSMIENLSTAKNAWEHLAEMYKPKSKPSLSSIWKIHFGARLMCK
ncbi:protein ACCELERATED CELL DEATH 6-like isoform X2 [Fagus crenata]